MTADLQAIAIEQRWCQSCPSGNLPTAGQVPWLGGPVRSAPPSWLELCRKTCICGNLHRAGATDTPSGAQWLTCCALVGLPGLTVMSSECQLRGCANRRAVMGFGAPST